MIVLHDMVSFNTAPFFTRDPNIAFGTLVNTDVIQQRHRGVRLTSADLLAMFTTPVMIVPPGAEGESPFMVTPPSVLFRHSTTPYTLNAATDYLIIGPYAAQADLVDKNMGTWVTPVGGLVDQATDATAQVWSTAGGIYGTTPHKPEEVGLWISVTGALTLGNGILDLHFDYRYLD